VLSHFALHYFKRGARCCFEAHCPSLIRVLSGDGDDLFGEMRGRIPVQDVSAAHRARTCSFMSAFAQITIKHVKDQPIFEIRSSSKSRFLRAPTMEVRCRSTS
jgi:hypothetical protein